MRGHLRQLAFHTLEPPNPTYPQAQSMTPSALPPRVRKDGALQTCDVFVPRGLLPLGLWNVLLPTRERVIRKGDVRVVFVIPRLAMPWGPVWRRQRQGRSGRPGSTRLPIGRGQRLDAALSQTRRWRAASKLADPSLNWPTPLGGCLPRSTAAVLLLRQPLEVGAVVVLLRSSDVKPATSDASHVDACEVLVREVKLCLRVPAHHPVACSPGVLFPRWPLRLDGG